MHRSSVVLCLSKPSTSIYLDFCPRDQCFKVAYIVEDCNYTVNPKCPIASGSSEHGSTGTDLVTDVALKEMTDVTLEEITDPHLEPLLCLDVTSEEEASESVLLSSRERLSHLIDNYNAVHPPAPGEDMTMEEDGSTFRGFIRVHMNLSRPISIESGPTDRQDNSCSSPALPAETKPSSVTSFYLPRDTVKALHITSEATTFEVIVTILLKFKVVDNPRKFALYERYFEEGDTVKVKMRRIGESEKPLVLALRWSQEQECNKMFVLQENETGDILWEAFSLPELGNFLRILDREEEEYKRIVRQKYQSLGKKLQDAMDKIHPPLQPASHAVLEDTLKIIS